MKAERARQTGESPVAMFAPMVATVLPRLHAKAFFSAAGLLALLAAGADAEEHPPTGPLDEIPVLDDRADDRSTPGLGDNAVEDVLGVGEEKPKPPPDRTPLDGLILTNVPGTCFVTNGTGVQVQCSVPALTDIQPVGSNPRANKMDWQGFMAHTHEWRARYTNHLAHFSPDYSDSTWMLGPPREGRLANPLPLASEGVAVAEIVVDLDPARHTPEATLGRGHAQRRVCVHREQLGHHLGPFLF